METLHELEAVPAPAEAADRPLASLLRWFTPERVIRLVDIAFVLAATGFVLGQLGLGNLLRNTTPTGGDMGAHVWGPAFLRDHVLPLGRLSGWTPDWYAGFPAYQFYMVIPALLIVALNAGVHGWAALGPLAAGLGAGALAWRQVNRPWLRRVLVTAAIVFAVLFSGLPYDVAFKVVTVLGLLSLPVAAYALGRLSGMPFPAPALFAVATVPFLFNRAPIPDNTGNIIGGNFTSTMAGEFSFSISLTFGVLFLGTVIGGLRTGRYRAVAAVLFALTVLCHLIVGIFVLVATALAWLVWPGRRRLLWLATALPAGVLLSAFWTFPFWARRAYVNDMGWEKLPAGAGKRSGLQLLGQFLTNGGDYGSTHQGYRSAVVSTFLVPSSLRWLGVLAAVAVVIALVQRIRVGIWLALVALAMAAGFIVAPETRLWNARLLPFYYLALFLLGALGVAELARAVAVLVAPDPSREAGVAGVGLKAAVAAVALGAVVVVVGLPLKALPGEHNDNGVLEWMGLQTRDRNPAPGWAQWNYTGYEAKPAYPEFYGFMATMQRIGQQQGCGRLMWEYDDPTLERYGTPMAPMLVSMFTDGCIGSMEGLYFESSTTTPFHFINQRELSTSCSCAQRNLPYGNVDVALGVRHLQLLGVRYYAAVTPGTKKAADANPDLVPIAQSEPWRIYEVRDADLVEPLANQPAVLTDHTDGLEWIYGSSDPHTAPVDANGVPIRANGPAMTWYTDPSRWNVYLAAGGPSSWARIEDGQAPPVQPVPQATVTGVRTGTDSIDFDVDRTGTPILVKTSYFPNWRADGADGPWRVTPNLMVVVPTANHVHLHYATTPVEYTAYAMTVVGIVAAVVLARRGALVMPEPRRRERDDPELAELDELT